MAFGDICFGRNSRHSGMSALPPKADIGTQSWNVRFVPKADIPRCGRDWRYSITSSAMASSWGGMFEVQQLCSRRIDRHAGAPLA